MTLRHPESTAGQNDHCLIYDTGYRSRPHTGRRSVISPELSAHGHETSYGHPVIDVIPYQPIRVCVCNIEKQTRPSA